MGVEMTLSQYRGTSLIRNRPTPGHYSRPWLGPHDCPLRVEVSYERGTPVIQAEIYPPTEVTRE